MVIAALCLVHCLALPLLVAVLPGLSLAVFEAEWVHKLLVVFAFGVGSIAMYGGLTLHRHISPVILAALGITVMASALTLVEGEQAETALTVIGASLTGCAHLANQILAARSRALLG